MSLELAAVRFGYASAEVVRGADLRVDAGELVGLIGPNGAGKSTLVGLASGILTPSAGDVRLEGRRVARYGRRALARRLAVVPQLPDLPSGFPARAIVAMGRAPHLGFFAAEGERDRRVIEDAMRRTDTLAFADQPVGSLSGGERQRVVLARALAQEPGWLLLDEPTTHLDLRYQAEMMRHAARLASEGLGVLAVLHDLNLAARCDRIVLLDAGRVAANGSPADVLQAPILRSVFRTDVRVEGGERPVVVPG